MDFYKERAPGASSRAVLRAPHMPVDHRARLAEVGWHRAAGLRRAAPDWTCPA